MSGFAYPSFFVSFIPLRDLYTYFVDSSTEQLMHVVQISELCSVDSLHMPPHFSAYMKKSLRNTEHGTEDSAGRKEGVND